MELAPYFRFENITGIAPNVYGQPIKEGAYQFCFEIIDVLSGNRLSQKSCATTVIFQNEPPFLVSPYNKINIEERNPQNIVFQWTPRQINVSNVEYELSIVEIWDNYVDPQAAFLSSPPIFQTTTTATTYVYGPSDPLFLSNKNYAWRVQAKARQGTEEIGLFKNQGYSEIYSFSYAGVCSLPSAINHEVKGSTNANIFWDDFSTDVPEYAVRYRKKGNGNEWFFNRTTSNTTTLWDLKAGAVYEYQVQKKCVVTQSDWSTVRQFTTFIADDEASVYECGITPDFSLDNTEPLPKITIGEQFTAGDFPVKILEVSGSNGRFTGKGYVTIPYLNSIRVGVEFTNVLINTDKQMAEGIVITMYDPTLANIVDVDVAIETVTDVVEAIGEPFEGNNDLDEIRINWVLDPENDIKIEDGILIITNPQNGATETSPLGDDKVVIDGEGNVYHVDAGGYITEGGKIDPAGSVSTGNVTGVSQDGELKALTAKGIIVTFEDNGKYGYDQMPETNSEKLKKEYVTILDADGNPYTLVHQAVAKGDVIKVRANVEFTNSDYTLKDLIFKTKSGEVIPWEEIDGAPVLTLTGRYTLENETIYAVVPSKTEEERQLTAGAFKLWHLTDRAVNVVLVAVDGVSIPQTTVDAVKDIFKKGVATLNLSTQSASLSKNVLGGDNELEIGDTPWLSNYNAEQKAVIEDLKSKIVYNSNAYYLFVFDSIVKTTKSIGGFMPLQRQFGFVFNGDLTVAEEGKDDLATTIAHELGHGVFALQHPFTEYGSAQGATDWLMDYKDDASLLPHMHWAQLHNPALKFYVFQDEEDGQNWAFAGSDVSFAKVTENFGKNVDSTFTFVTPAGDFVDLPSDVLDVTFYYGIQNPGLDSKSLPGTLFSFKLLEGGKPTKYKSKITEGIFEGYFSENNKDEQFKSSSNNGKFHIMFLTSSVDEAKLYLVESTTTKAYDGTSKKIPEIFDFPIWPYQISGNVRKTKSLRTNGMFGNSQTSYKKEILQQVFNYSSEDESLFLKNRILEVAHAYQSLFEKSANPNWFDNWQACNPDYIQTRYAFEKDLIEVYCDCNYVATGDMDPEDVTSSGYYQCDEKQEIPKNRFNYLKEYYSFLMYYVQKQQQEAYSFLYTIKDDPDLIDITEIAKISNTINAASEQDIVRTLNVELIYRLISKILSQGEITEGSTFTTQYEKSVLHLLNVAVNEFNSTDKGILLTKIESKNYYSNLPDNDKYLYQQLFTNVDDDILFNLTSNNRKELIVLFTKLILGATDFYEKRLSEAIDNIGDRIFVFEYNNFIKNIGIEILSNNIWTQIVDKLSDDAITKNLKIKDISYDFMADGTIRLKQTDDLGFSSSGVIFSPDPDLKPFDLVLFTNKSNITLLKEYEQAIGYTGNIPLPAIALAYVSDSGNKETTLQGISTSFDVASLIGTGGTLNSIKGLSKLRKILLVSDLVSSGTGIVSTSISDNAELAELKTALDIFSTATGVAGAFDNLATLGDRPMREIISEVAKNYSGSNDIPSLVQLNSVFDSFDNLNESKLLTLVSDEKEAVKYIEVLFLKIIKDASDAGKTSDLNRVTKILERLKKAKLALVKSVFLTNAGKILKTENNILGNTKSIAGRFKSFTYKVGETDSGEAIIEQVRAGTFWNLGKNSTLEHTQYLSRDSKFYVKLVPDAKDGRLLFFDAEKQIPLGWGFLSSDGAKLLDPLVTADDYEKLIDKLKFIHGFDRTTKQLNFGSKGTLVRYTDKLNVYLGSYNPSRTTGAEYELGTKDVLDQLNMYKNYRFAENSPEVLKGGSISLLNLPDEMAGMPNTANFFDDFNVKYLDFLIENKDKIEIIFTTNPIHQDLFKAWKNGRVDQNEITGLYAPSGFAKEIKYLRDRDVKIVKFKDGTSLNLDEVDLSNMDWITNWKY
ncbi:fibronectin type III domain-containing protein [Sediminicola sp. 1XM1-17]|uniref:fibronectin type III domain-containing protein n=1 Tax=Sediminicola sp. 1XM1-17 TaxID=3127702 RepID=UPI0030785CB4